MPGLAKTVGEQQRRIRNGTESLDRERDAIGRAQAIDDACTGVAACVPFGQGYHTGEYVWRFSSCQYGGEWFA